MDLRLQMNGSDNQKYVKLKKVNTYRFGENIRDSVSRISLLEDSGRSGKM